MARIRTVFLLLLAGLLLGGCRDQGQTPQAPPPPATPAATPAPPEPLAEASLPDPRRVDPDVQIASPQVYTGPVPRLIIWPAVIDDSAEESREEIEYFMNILETCYGFAPEIVVDVLHIPTEGRLYAAKGSPDFRPLAQFTDQELSGKAKAYEAATHLRTEFKRGDSGLEATFRLISAEESSELLRISAVGGWDGINEGFFARNGELLAGAGATLDARQSEVVSRSLFGKSTEHLVKASAAEKEKGDEEALAQVYESWLKAEPEVGWVRARVLTDRLLANKYGAKEDILKGLGQAGPFDARLALSFADTLESQGNQQTALVVMEALAKANPASLRAQLQTAMLALGLAEYDKALEWIAKAEAISEENWLVQAQHAEICSRIGDSAQRGRYVGLMTEQEVRTASEKRLEAKQRLARAAKLNPEDSWVSAACGRNALWTGEDDQAVIDWCKKAMRQDPGRQSPISTMLWLYTAGYRDDQEAGLKILMEYKDQLTNPGAAMEAATPLLILATGYADPSQATARKFTEAHVREAVAMSQIILRGFAAQGVDRERRFNAAWIAASTLTDRQCTTSDLAPLRDNYLYIQSPNLHEQQWFHACVGWIMEEGGDLQTAKLLYDLAYRGPNGQKSAESAVRLLVVLAKEGKVTEALDGLAARYGNIQSHDNFLMEILSQGTPEQRREAVRIGERLMTEERFTIGHYRRIAEAYFAVGEPAKVRELTIANISHKHSLDPCVEPRWKKACEQLGVSDEWPPADVATPTPAATDAPTP